MIETSDLGSHRRVEHAKKSDEKVYIAIFRSWRGLLELDEIREEL